MTCIRILKNGVYTIYLNLGTSTPSSARGRSPPLGPAPQPVAQQQEGADGDSPPF